MPLFLDNRALQPPEPLVRTLEAIDRLQSGETLEVLFSWRPAPLLQDLAAMGCHYEVEDLSDESVRVVITRV